MGGSRERIVQAQLAREVVAASQANVQRPTLNVQRSMEDIRNGGMQALSLAAQAAIYNGQDVRWEHMPTGPCFALNFGI